MKLIEEWKECWKWFSVQANVIGGSISVGYAAMYEQLKDTIPAPYMAGITAAVFVLGIVGRLANQTKAE